MHGGYRRFGAILTGGGLLLLAVHTMGCSSGHANCQTVHLQREAGRSDSEIAAALGVSESDIAKCGSGAQSSGEAGSSTPTGEGQRSGKPPM